jgi:hypothetical protein
MNDGHAFLESAAGYGTEQKPGPAFIGLEQHHRCGRPLSCQDQTGQPSSRAQIENPGRLPGVLGTCECDEPFRMDEVPLY